jgi:ribosomal protein S18 acetylase RimI-like enzyme
MEIIIRRAVEADYEQLCLLWDEVDRLHRQRLPAIFRRPDGPVREWAYFAGLLTDENVGLFLAQAEGELLGFIHVVVAQAREIPLFVPRRFAVIDDLVVSEPARRQGIGSLLIEQAEDWARERALTTIELTVYEFNQGAIALYEKTGYETLSRRMTKSLE